MNRRDFFLTSAGAVIATAAARARAQESGSRPAQGSTRAAKLARIAIMTFSFDRLIRVEGRPNHDGRPLTLLDMPELLADKYGVHNVEIQHNQFPAVDPAYRNELKSRLARAKSRVSNINLEFEALTISAEDPVRRNEAVALTQRWIDYAVDLGSPRVMINQGRPTRENKAAAVSALRQMVEYGKTKNIKVSAEPRNSGPGGGRGGPGGGPGAAGAPSGRGPTGPQPGAAPAGSPIGSTQAATPGAGNNPSAAAAGTMQPPQAPSQGSAAAAGAAASPGEPAWMLLTEIIKESGASANVDIGALGDQQMQHQALRVMLPLTVGNTHIKNNPARYDMVAALALMRELNYGGLYSVEAGGADPYASVQVIYDALLEHI